MFKLTIRAESALRSAAGARGFFSTAAFAQETLGDLIRAGQRDAVLAAITSPDLDVNTPEADGSTALLWATYKVDHELVRALLKAGAKANVTNNYGSSPLTEAVKLGDVELVRILLDAKAPIRTRPIRTARRRSCWPPTIGSMPIAQLLISRGANVNAVENFRGQTALMWAAAGNYPEIVDLLLLPQART